MPLDVTTAAGRILVRLPPNTNLTINGVTIDPTQVLALAEVGGNEYLATAWIFEALEGDQVQSETCNKHSQTKYTMRGSTYWRMRASGSKMDANAPNVVTRPPPFATAWPFGR